MLYSKLTKNSKINSNLIIDKNIILHFIPDFNTNIINFIDNMNINLTNLQGILIKLEMIKLSSSFINTRNYFNNLKNDIQDHKKITIYNISPNEINRGKFLIYDHSPLVNLLEIYNESNIKKSTEFLIDHLKNTNINLKLKYPSFENVPIFYLNNKDGVINNINKMKYLKDLMFFDKFALISLNGLILTFGSFDRDGNPELNNSSITNVISELKKIKINLNPTINSKLLNRKIEIKSNIEKVDKLDIDIEKLSSSLNSLKISDKTIIDNFKEAITKKINSDVTSLNDDDLGMEILKSANKVIFNTSNIKQLYKNEPPRLLTKLKDVNIYKQDLYFPESENLTRLSDPNIIIKLKNISGPVRHKYEFNENIDFNVEKLFKTLEYKQNPIKIIKISKELKDNDLERFSEYTIKLKNLNENSFNDPYEIKLKLPNLINDKYFKLNGKEYIISTQQFLNPITKDKPTEVRFLTHYSMIRLRLKNLKYAPSEIKSILTIINNKYSNYVLQYDEIENSILFKNHQSINLNDHNKIYDNGHIDDTNIKLKLINGKYVIYENDKHTSTEVLKNEYLFDKLHEIIPELNLKIANKSVQYIQCYIVGAWIPLILYFWQQLGLIETLIRFNLDYSFGDSPLNTNKYLRFELKDTSLFIYPENKREEFIANGLYIINKRYFSDITKNDLNDRNSCYEYILSEYGGSIIEKFDGALENMIDPITKDLLEFEDHPTNLLDNLSGPCIDKLLNDDPDHPSDLKSLRARQSEYLMHLLYNEINISLYS